MSVVQQPVPAMPLPPGVPGVQVQNMEAPAPIPGCPPGLEYLAQLDQVKVTQQVELLEVLTGLEGKNKFRVLNSMNQQVYFAAEESPMCMRLCCGPNRGFVFNVTDNFNQTVLRVRRDFQCGKGMYFCPCESCFYFAAIEDRDGQVLGWISNLCFCCSPRFGIYDADRTLVAEIKGPFCPIQTVCCTADIDFPIVEMNGAQIGTMSKVWEGFLQAAFTKADNFRVSFPIGMDVRRKALMIASVFVIDMMLFEAQNNGLFRSG